MAQCFANAARAQLAIGISADDTSLTLFEFGEKFPVANTNTNAIGPDHDWFKVVLQDNQGIEIVYVRTHNNGSMAFTNVMRGQEGTAARGFGQGTVVGQRITAGDLGAVNGLVLGGYAVDVSGGLDGDVLQLFSSKWSNRPQESLTDCGNF